MYIYSYSRHSGSLVSSIITVAGDNNGLMLNPTVDVRLSCSVKYVTFPSSSHSVSSEILYSRHSSTIPFRNFIFRLHSSVYSALETSPISIKSVFSAGRELAQILVKTLTTKL